VKALGLRMRLAASCRLPAASFSSSILTCSAVQLRRSHPRLEHEVRAVEAELRLVAPRHRIVAGRNVTQARRALP